MTTPVSLREQTLRRQMGDPRPRTQIAAIKATDTLDARSLAPDILRRFKSESDWEIRKECIVALGHMKHRESLPTLKRAAADQKEDLLVRKWAIWAVGELGTTAEESFLLRLQRTKLHPLLAQVTGGALKKVRLDSVRTPKAVIERQMYPPTTRDPRVKRIRDELQEIGPTRSGSLPPRVVALRREMKDLDEQYFNSYMDWLRRLPDLEQALSDPKVSY